MSSAGNAFFLLSRRAAWYGGVLFAAITLNFALPRLAPGDPAYFLVGRTVSELTVEQRQALLAEVGLDRPLFEQYRRYLAGIFTGDWGVSLRYGTSVTSVLADRLPWTLLLGGSAMVLSVALGIGLGVFAAWKRGRKEDFGSLFLAMVFDSMPAFVVAMILIGVFSVTLGWLPAFGAGHPDATHGLAFVWETFRHLILPVVTLTITHIGGLFLITRFSMMNAMNEDYVVMAAAKGVGDGVIAFRHALPNALLPIYTNIAVSIGTFMGGNVVVETVFSYPGLGRLIYDSIFARDYNVLQGAFLLVVVLVVGVNFLADMTYPLFDPRVRRPGART